MEQSNHKGLSPIGSSWELIVRSKNQFFSLFSAVVLCMMGPALLNFIAAMMMERGMEGAPIVSFISGLATMIAVVAVARLALGHDEKSAQAAIAWSFRNFLSYLWIAVIVSLVSIAAYSAFVIPGFAVSVALSFVMFEFVQGKRGLHAVSASAELTERYRMGIFGRMLLLGAILLLIMIPIQIIGDIFKISLLTESLYAYIVMVPIMVVLGSNIFRKLREIKGDVTGNVKRRYYKVLAIIGTVIVGLVLLAAMLLQIFSDRLIEFGRRLRDDVRVEIEMNRQETNWN